MSMGAVTEGRTSPARATRPGMLDREFWGGVTLVTIWLAVLFVGVFGGDIKTVGSDGSAASIPVVVVVAIVALLATVSVGRWAFRQRPTERQ